MQHYRQNREKNPRENHNYYAILDSGTTDTYLTEAAPVIHKTTDHEEIIVTIPDGSQLNSSHKSTLDLTLLRIHHPGLKTPLPIFSQQLCKAGCKVIFDKKNALYFTKDMK